MPIYHRRDVFGTYFQWGDSGHKYYYHNKFTKAVAYSKALLQSRAAYSNGYQHLEEGGGNRYDIRGRVRYHRKFQ